MLRATYESGVVVKEHIWYNKAQVGKSLQCLAKVWKDTAPVESYRMKKQFKAVLESAFQRLDLVSREEFDIQVKVLQKTRAQLTELQDQLASLEQHISEQDSDNA